MEHFYQNIFGYFDFEDIYRSAIERSGSNPVLVEVGVGLGKSLAYLTVEAHQQREAPRVFGVDKCMAFDGQWDRTHWPADLAVENHAQQIADNLQPVQGKYELVVAASTDAAARFDDESCDLVFIDAAHDCESVKADLLAWWPKVKAGGTFAGHDYGSARHEGVLHAVNEFAEANVLKLQVSNYSWFIIKGA